ncbi:MAG: hypothetical protein Q9177_000235 [Variospora cf. flavescens]
MDSRQRSTHRFFHRSTRCIGDKARGNDRVRVTLHTPSFVSRRKYGAPGPTALRVPPQPDAHVGNIGEKTWRGWRFDKKTHAPHKKLRDLREVKKSPPLI